MERRPSHSYFEARKKIFPQKIDGSFRRLKWVIMAVTLGVYYVTPWLRWNRGPYSPAQAVLVDLAHRRFYMFGIEIWPQEFYYVAGLLIMAGIGLFLVTSAVGRAWCGYACPQTVWTDVFVHVERLVDGDRNAQYRLLKAKWGPAKLARRVLKHGLWLLIATATGGAWIFYFADAPSLWHALVRGEAPFVAYGTIGILTGTTYILGALLREQVCIYMCPWPRIQSAMLDEQSLMVTYKYWRGEPRTHGLKRARELPCDEPAGRERAAQAGDCIDCRACIAVCPTGIDIREGPQIGCITCGLCIDACDRIMEQVGKPRRLIGYTSVADEKLALAGQPTRSPLERLFHWRTLLYLGVWSSIGLAMLFLLGHRQRLVLDIGHDRNPVSVRLSDGSVRNGYTVTLRNMEDRPRRVSVTFGGPDRAVLWQEESDRAHGGQGFTTMLPPDQVRKIKVYVAAPSDDGQRPILFAAAALDRDATHVVAASVFDQPE